MATVVEPHCAPELDSSLGTESLAARFTELRDCQARYADFTLGMFDHFERLGTAMLDKELSLDSDRRQAAQSREQQADEVAQARAEMDTVCDRLEELETQLTATRHELEQERQCTASEKVSLDDETRDFLDELVHERDALRAQLEAMQEKSEEQQAGYESEVELLRHQLRDANQQVVKLRKRGDEASAPVESVATATLVAGDVSRRAEDVQAPCDTAETSPSKRAAVQPAAPNKKRPSAAEPASQTGSDLESLMSQVRMLQQDVARRRGKSVAKK